MVKRPECDYSNLVRRGRKPKMCVCVFITGESESQNKEKQIWSYEERRGIAPRRGREEMMLRWIY